MITVFLAISEFLSRLELNLNNKIMMLLNKKTESIEKMQIYGSFPNELLLNGRIVTSS